MAEVMGRYYEYLESAEWRKKRADRILVDGGACRICGAKSELQIHHITYDNVYNEDIYRDLITLCRRCHHRIHCQVESMRGLAEEVILAFVPDVHEAIKGVNGEYIDKQAEVLSDVLVSYNDDEWKNIQTVTRLIRNLIKIDWPDVNKFVGSMKYGGKQLHSTSIQMASKKRKIAARQARFEYGEKG